MLGGSGMWGGEWGWGCNDLIGCKQRNVSQRAKLKYLHANQGY